MRLRSAYKLLLLVIIIMTVSISMTACDMLNDSEESAVKEEIEIIAEEIETEPINIFDFRNSEMKITVEGIDSGRLSFRTETAPAVPEEKEFTEGKIELESLYTYTGDDKLIVTVKNEEGKKLTSLSIQLEELEEKEDIASENGLEASRADSESIEDLLGFFVEEDYSSEYEEWIYKNAFYVRDKEPSSQQNLLQHLEENQLSSYYVDGIVHEGYDSWARYKVVGHANLEGKFKKFFENNAISQFLDVESGEVIEVPGIDTATLFLEVGEGEGSIIKPGEGEFSFNRGKEVELIAEADEGWKFVNWTGDIIQDQAEITITIEEDKEVFANFAEEEGVEFEDPNLEDVIREKIDKSSGPIYRAEVEEIKYLSAQGQGIESLEDIQYLINLEELQLRPGSEGGERTYNYVEDLSPLKDLENLKNLNVAYNQISSVEPLEGISSLRRLTLGPRLIKSWRPPSPEGVTLPRNDISDISPLANLKNLESLSITGNEVADIEPLGSMTNLTRLFAFRCDIEDISPLANLTELERLYLGENQVEDISVLSGLVQLEHLVFSNNQVGTLKPLENLGNLTRLDFWGNDIEEISVVANFTKLTELDFHKNEVNNITPLENLTELEKLWFYDNNVKDISPLQGLTNLNDLHIANNEIYGISYLVEDGGIGKGEELDIRWNYLDLSSGSQDMEYIEILKDRWKEVEYDPQEELPTDYVDLILSVEGEGEVKIEEEKIVDDEITLEFEKGSEVDLEASPAEGWEWKHWEGDVEDSFEDSTRVVMNEDKIVTAVFGGREAKTKFRLINSWGDNWGPFDDGSYYMTDRAAVKSGLRTYIMEPREEKYDPSAIAHFEVKGESREDWEFSILFPEIGEEKYFYHSYIKEFDSRKGGEHDFEFNSLAIDITEHLPFENEDIVLRVTNNSPSNGSIQSYYLEINETKYEADSSLVSVEPEETVEIPIKDVEETSTAVRQAFFGNILSDVSRELTEEDVKKFAEEAEKIQAVEADKTGLETMTEEDWRKAKEENIIRVIEPAEVVKTFGESGSEIDHAESKHFPPITRQQGGSCVPWSLGTYQQGFYQARLNNWSPSLNNKNQLLDALFLYVLVNDGTPASGYLRVASMINHLGVSDFESTDWDTLDHDPYHDWPNEKAFLAAPENSSAKPDKNNPNTHGEASLYFLYISEQEDVEALKTLLEEGYVATISMHTDLYDVEDFKQNGVWTAENYILNGTNHANTIVGFEE